MKVRGKIKLFDMYSPITYNTNIGPLCLEYLSGGATYGSGFGGGWGNSFNLNSLYTYGSGYVLPGQTNYYANNYSLFSDTNWCNWSGGLTTPSYYPSYSQYGDGFGYKSLFSNQEWCNWHGKSPSVSSASSSASTSSVEEKKSTTTDKSQKSSTTNPIKKNETSKINLSQETKTSKHSNKKPTLQEGLIKTAFKYRGLNEADGSWRQISNSKEWCADFIYHVIDETYKEQGKPVPKGLEKELPPGKPNHRVEELKQWGIDNGKFFQTANKKNKGKLIAENVKPGDILILREDGASHTGFVTKVYSDGVFETIEGNRNDKVCRVRYSPNYHEISGFVQLR